MERRIPTQFPQRDGGNWKFVVEIGEVGKVDLSPLLGIFAHFLVRILVRSMDGLVLQVVIHRGEHRGADFDQLRAAVIRHNRSIIGSGSGCRSAYSSVL